MRKCCFQKLLFSDFGFIYRWYGNFKNAPQIDLCHTKVLHYFLILQNALSALSSQIITKSRVKSVSVLEVFDIMQWFVEKET